jgi:hypothetical protein
MREAVPPLPNTPSGRGAQLKSIGAMLPLPLPSQKIQRKLPEPTSSSPIPGDTPAVCKPLH